MNDRRGCAHDDGVVVVDGVRRCRHCRHPMGGDPDDAYLHGRRLHTIIEENAARIAQEEAERREGQVVTWLRAHWPWYWRWAIGYPRAIRVLDRLGLVVLPVFVMNHPIGGGTKQLKDSTT